MALRLSDLRRPAPPHLQTCPVEWRQQRRFADNPLGNVYRTPELVVIEVPSGRTPYELVPALADGVVQADAHEAMIYPDRPAVLSCHAGQRIPGQG